MSPQQRLELFMAIDEIRHYLDAAPNSCAVVDANRLCFAARLRGVKLPLKAFEQAMDWLDRHQARDHIHAVTTDPVGCEAQATAATTGPAARRVSWTLK